MAIRMGRFPYCQDISMAGKPRFRATTWLVEELIDGQWKAITEPLTRFSQAVKVYDQHPMRRLLHNGKPLPTRTNDPHPILFEG